MESLTHKFQELGIVVKGDRIEQKVKCPNCKEIGKTNISDTCLSINLTTGLYNCHKCGWKGCVKPKDEFMQRKEYSLPDKTNFTKLSEKALEFFTNRGISQPSIINNKIAMSKDGESVIFPYIRNGEFVNFKQRFIDRKDFRQAKDAEPIMFNYDRCVGQKEIIVCEGEIDAMSFDTVGFPHSTSVNQGAPNVNDANIEKKLECITNCYELFENAEKIYIAVDADANGKRLEQELIRRFGAEKCWIVDFNGCKDANEVLMTKGVTELRKVIENAKEVPVSGIFRAEDVRDEMKYSFHHGKPRGTTTHIPEVDLAWTWRNDVTIWTGYQNEGKTAFLMMLCMLKAYWEGWKFAVFSPENAPISEFYDDLIEAFVGKPTDPYFSNRMSEAEYDMAFNFVNDHFFVIYPEKDFELETIFNKATHLIRKHGCRALVIDPYNTIEHKMRSGEREDLYISRFMGQLKEFSISNMVSVQLVAHQVTPSKGSDGKYPRPDLNRIKGGGTFADKVDNVCFVWRPERAINFASEDVTFGSQKIKKQRLTGVPQDVVGIRYIRSTSRYYINGKSPFDAVDEDVRKRFEGEQNEIDFELEATSAIRPSETFDSEGQGVITDFDMF